MVKYLTVALVSATLLFFSLSACNDDSPSPTQPSIIATPIPIDEPFDDPDEEPTPEPTTTATPASGVVVNLDDITLDNCLAFAACAEANMADLGPADRLEIPGFHNVMKIAKASNPNNISEQHRHFCKQNIDKFNGKVPMCAVPSSFGTLAK